MRRIRRGRPLPLPALTLAAGLASLPGLLPGDAAAQVATVSPRTIRVPLGRARPVTVSLLWRTTAPRTSPGGLVVADATPSTTLEVLPPFAGSATSFPETVTIAASDVQELLQDGVRRILIHREFVSGSFSDTATAVVEITSPMGADFGILRIQLRIGEGAPIRLVHRGAELTAWADLTYSGTGMLQALWEVAESASTGGEPVFRPLRRVHRPLGGGQRVSIGSPSLPTDTTGLHLVRLQVTEPEPGFEPPTLRYYVAPEGEAPPEPVALVVGEPAHGARLQPSTRFTWRPVRGARAYRLELYPGAVAERGEHVRFDPEHPAYADARAPGAGPGVFEGEGEPRPPVGVAPGDLQARPVTGMMVGPERRSLVLSPATRSRLRPGERYVWVVRALGPEGVVLAMSPPRVLRVPR